MKIFDTDVLVGWLRGNDDAETALARAGADAGTTAINAAELLFGATLARDPEGERGRVMELLTNLPVLPFTLKSASAYAIIATKQRASGSPSGFLDSLVGAVALSEGAVVVTRNRRHFESMPGVEVESW